MRPFNVDTITISEASKTPLYKYDIYHYTSRFRHWMNNVSSKRFSITAVCLFLVFFVRQKKNGGLQDDLDNIFKKEFKSELVINL